MFISGVVFIISIVVAGLSANQFTGNATLDKKFAIAFEVAVWAIIISFISILYLTIKA
jgi:hypothetical protein